MSIISEYKKKTKKSAKLFALSSKLHVNGVSHNIRFYDTYPFVVKKSSGKNLVDVDDNRYTDYWMGHWSLILGHGPKSVKEKLQKQITKSWMYGTVNEQTIKLSELIEAVYLKRSEPIEIRQNRRNYVIDKHSFANLKESYLEFFENAMFK